MASRRRLGYHLTTDQTPVKGRLECGLVQIHVDVVVHPAQLIARDAKNQLGDPELGDESLHVLVMGFDGEQRATHGEDLGATVSTSREDRLGNYAGFFMHFPYQSDAGDSTRNVFRPLDQD